MKTVTLEQFLTFGPCWLEEEGGRERLERIAAWKKEWTALDVLRLPDKEVSPEDKLWAVLREEFVDARTLHEFACICAERALTLAGVKDERCWNAIKAKRAWLRGEISDDELDAARAASWAAASAAARAASWDAASAAASAAESAAAWAAAWAAASAAAWDAARAAASAAASAAESAAASAAAWAAASAAERKWQCEKLIEFLESEGAK